MLTVLSFCAKDADQAERLARWLIDLNGCKGHELLLGVDSGVTTETAGRIMQLFRESFDKVTVLPIANPYNEWPAACNHAFAYLARHIENEQLVKYFCWIEPDIIFIKPGALDAFQAEFERARKPFMGAFVNVPNVVPHMSGCGIYPAVMTRWAGLALISWEEAWDCSAASQIVPHMHKTNLLVHNWRHGPFKDQSEVDNLLAANPEMVLFHSDKTSSLTDLLRERLKGGVAEQAYAARDNVTRHAAAETKRVIPDVIAAAEKGPQSTAGSNPASSAFTVDFLIKSYPPDYEFLSYCLRSIDKFASGFREVVLIIPTNQTSQEFNDFIDGRKWNIPIRIIHAPEPPDGYLTQQTYKASAHEFTDSDFVCHLDSDCVLTKPITPDSFFHDGKPIWYMTKYSEIEAPWKPFTEKFLGEPVEYEFMRRLPMLLPTSLHRALSAFCLVHHRMRLTDYILSQPNRSFSEFNALGALAYTRARDEFHWIDTTTVEMPEPFAIQHFSYSGLTDELRGKLEQIVGGNNDNVANNTGALVANENITQTKEGWWIIDGDQWISKWVEESGRLDHDQFLLPRILPEIPEGGVVVECGSFIGDHTWAFRQKAGYVVAIEANPDAVECLKRNCPNVNVIHGALSHTLIGNLSWIRDEQNAGASHILGRRDNALDKMVPVPIVTIDSLFMERCDLIAMDIEGFELYALQGAVKTIEKLRPKLLIEVNEGALKRQGTSSKELFQWLREHDYEWSSVQELHVPDPPQYDVICRYKGKEGDAKCHSHQSHITTAATVQSVCTGPVISKSAKEVGSNVAPTVQPIGAADLEQMRNVLIPEITPWANRDESIAYIDKVAADLLRFCTAPRLTLIVRERLRKIRVITKVR